MSLRAAGASNRLLHRLPLRERGLVDAQSERVDLVAGQLLGAGGTRIGHAVFPVTAIVSLRAATREADSLQVALFGSDGMFGVALRGGADVTSLTGVIEVAGTAIRIESRAFRRLRLTCAALGARLDRYAGVLLADIARGVACNRFHSVESRVARLLLTISDRGAPGTFSLTQTMLADMLGVRRSTISAVAGALSSAGLVHYSRGRVAVVDRDGLRAAACSCYVGRPG